MAHEADALAGEVADGRGKNERSTASLLADLAAETAQLIRQELALLKAELREKFGRAGRGALALVLGVALVLSGWFVLLAAAVLGLAQVLPPWLAALVVGGLFVMLGALFLVYGKRRLGPGAFVPRRTLDSLREDEARIRERFR